MINSAADIQAQEIIKICSLELICIHWLLLADFSFFGQGNSRNETLNTSDFSSENVFFIITIVLFLLQPTIFHTNS